MTKLRRILKCKAGNGFPLVVAITLALILILCGVMEFFRLNIIASGAKEALQECQQEINKWAAIISRIEAGL